MSIIIQPKRILITDFIDEKSQGSFIRFNTIQDTDMYNRVSKEWVALYETIYKGQPALAIPRRFPPQYLERYVDNSEIIKDKGVVTSDTRDIENNFEPKSEEQAEIIDFLLGRNKFEHISKKSRKAVFAETGAGKTFSTLKAISIHKLFTFINCPDDKAILTWRQEMAKFTNIEEDDIFVLAGRNNFSKLVKNKDKYKIVLGSSKTFSSLISSNDYVMMEEFFRDMEFGLIVHDEAHLNLNVLFHIEMMTNSSATYYLTATPGRRIFKEAKVLQNLLPPEDCVFQPEPKDKYYVRECIYYSNTTAAESKGLNKPKGFDYLAYGKRIIFNPKSPRHKDYMEYILPRVIKAARKVLSDKENNKVAIICKTKAENDLLYDYMVANFPDLSVGKFNSDIVDMDERYAETNKQIIISTDKSFAGIINIPKLESIILLYPMSSEQHLLQIVGRIRNEPNKKAFVYIMVDGTFSRCKKTSYYAKRILEPYSKEIITQYLNEKEEVDVSLS